MNKPVGIALVEKVFGGAIVDHDVELAPDLDGAIQIDAKPPRGQAKFDRHVERRLEYGVIECARGAGVPLVV
jgi:hypothetical protein